MTKRVRETQQESPFLRIDQVLKIVPICRSSIYMMIADGEFPAPKKLGKRAAAWSKKEIAEWVESKLR